MHEEVMRKEGKDHNLDGKCPICKLEGRVNKRRLQLVGDPSVTAGRG